MEKLETGWLYRRMLKNEKEYEKISQWQEMAEDVLDHGGDDRDPGAGAAHAGIRGKEMFRYAVVRCVMDHARDEAVNLGVLLAPAGGGAGTARIVGADVLARRFGDDQAKMLGMVAGSLAEECREGVPLWDLEKRYVHRIRLSRPMPALVVNPAAEADEMFGRFVSITGGDILPRIRDLAWGMMRGMEGARRDAVVEGRRHRARFDLAHGDGPSRMIHFVDLGGPDALREAMLFDWNASDVIDAGAHEAGSFVPVLVRGGGGGPAGDAARILDRYDVRYLDAADWRDGLSGILGGH